MTDLALSELAAAAEQVSAAYATQHGIRRDGPWFALKLAGETGEAVNAYLALAGQSRASGLEYGQLQDELARELADVVCHALLLGWHAGVDVAGAIGEKWLVWLADAAC